MARITVHAVIDIEDKHAGKVAARFNEFLDALPAQIAHVTVADRTVTGLKGKSDGKQVPRQPSGKPVGRVEGQ